MHKELETTACILGVFVVSQARPSPSQTEYALTSRLFVRWYITLEKGNISWLQLGYIQVESTVACEDTS